MSVRVGVVRWIVALVARFSAVFAAAGGTAEAERPEGSVASLARAKILYVWRNDTAARDAFDTLFSDFGAQYYTVFVEQVAEMDLSPFDYIVIGHDTGIGLDGDWGVEGSVDQEHILASGRTILGIGDGGAIFWDSVGVVDIGWGRSATGLDVTTVFVHMPAHAAWTGPNTMLVDPGDTVVMYSQGATATQLSTTDDPQLTSTFEGENANPEDATYYLILFQDADQLQWGFNGNPANLTNAGKFALTNFLANAPRFFDHSVMLPMVAAGQ